MNRNAGINKVASFLIVGVLWSLPVTLSRLIQAQSSRDSMPLESIQLVPAETLQKFVPVLPEVRQHFWKLDPQTGYAVHSVGGGMYVISDNGWQSAWLVTDEGVIVFDAPASFGKSIPSEIAKVTNKPIKFLIYSHIHKDHIGGAAAFKNIPGLRIVATQPVAEFLSEQNDPDRPVPDVTFSGEKTITLGGKKVELTRHFYHSNTGDLFIYVPSAKFMMAIDCVTAGYAPFQGFDITENFGEYLKVFDQLLAYDFDTFVGGHLTDIGTKKDVLETKEFTFDVYNTVKRIHNNMDQKALVAQAARTVGSDNEFLLFKVVLDKVAYDSIAELQPRWINRLAGVDVWLESHVRTAILYVRWDEKTGGHNAESELIPRSDSFGSDDEHVASGYSH
ncbi:MAG: MBL fold metallo-hydrolase [Acidobacteriaceae bacterium]|nr:MBL fold metallo-hydrolase [Acidobacteriaceae bacterium]